MARIFFVDDQIDLYTSQIALLMALGHEVHAIESDALFRHGLNKVVRIDLLITDFMGGMATPMARLVYLKRHCEGNGVPVPPVIVFSSTPERDVRQECRELHVEELLTAAVSKNYVIREVINGTKFVHFPDLTSKVRELLAK